MSFFGRFLTKVKFFLIDRANRTRFSETRSLSDQNCMLKNVLFLKVTEKIYVNSRLVSAPRPKISNLLRFENGFEIRDLHQFASKNVLHTISQILRVTEIQQFRSNQLLTKNQ